MVFNRITPAGYLHHLSRDPLPGTPKHNVLLQYGLGDWEVSWLGAQQMGRSINAFMYEGNAAEYNESIYSLNWIDNDVKIDTNAEPGQSMIQGWNFDQPEMPFVNLPPNEGQNVHQWVGQQYDAQEAAFVFYEEGIIENACGGVCNGQQPQSAPQMKYDERSWQVNKAKLELIAEEFNNKGHRHVWN